MATDKQIEANRRNALLSTGPRSLAGKKKSSLNALRHGLTSEHIVLPGDDAEEFRQMRGALFASLRPEGVLENQLVERIATATWRLLRIPVFEAALFDWGAHILAATHDAPDELSDAPDVERRNDPFPQTSDPIHDLQDSLRLGRVLESLLSTDALTKLIYYEGRLQRQLSAYMADLLKLQRPRQEAQKLAEKEKASAKPKSRGAGPHFDPENDPRYYAYLDWLRQQEMGPP